jgi:anti-anti-sigma factor
MDVQLEWEQDARAILTCSGKMGWDAQDEMVRTLTAALDGRDQPQVLIDLERVELITSAGLGGLLQVRKLVNDRGGRLVLACASPLVGQLFRTVGLDRHVQLADTLEDARMLVQQVN